MKKNRIYIQTTIMNELVKSVNTRKIAEYVMDALCSKHSGGIEINDTDTYEYYICYRRKKDFDPSDNDIVSAFTKGIRALLDDSQDVIDEIEDNYDFEYDKKYLDDVFFSHTLIIRRKGRLISVEIDLQ